jgi:steroid delta-isomerase-like uncharacterized protein
MNKTTSNENKEIVRIFFENFEKGNRDEVIKLLGDNYLLHISGQQNPLTRQEGIALMKDYNTAFPDLKFTVQLQLTDGEYVITRAVGRATHKGEFNGIPATNKKVTATSITIHHIVNGKIVEEFTEFDGVGLWQQIGALNTETRPATSTY